MYLHNTNAVDMHTIYPLLLQSTRGPVSNTFHSDLQKQLAQLQKISIDMDALWRMQSMRETSSKRDIWKRKVEQVAEEADALRIALDKVGVSHQRRHIEEAQRQELLQRRADGWPVVDLGEEIAARKRLQSSKQVVEEAYQTGVNVLGAMSTQRDTLKNAHRKALDVLTALGLSDSILKLAERRIAMDKLIAYGGMLGTTVLIIVLYWWLR